MQTTYNDTVEKTSNWPAEKWLEGIYIQFDGESGMDWGALTRCAEIAENVFHSFQVPR